MRALTAALAAIFLLSQAAVAQVKFSPPGTSEEFSGRIFLMKQTSVAKKRHAGGIALIGYNSSSDKWAIKVKARNLKPNATYVLAVVGPTGHKVIGKSATSDSMGNLSIQATGSFNASDYTDLALYRRPKSSDKPQHGDIRLLSLRIRSVMDTMSAGAGPKKPTKKTKTH